MSTALVRRIFLPPYLSFPHLRFNFSSRFRPPPRPLPPPGRCIYCSYEIRSVPGILCEDRRERFPFRLCLRVIEIGATRFRKISSAPRKSAVPLRTLIHARSCSSLLNIPERVARDLISDDPVVVTKIRRVESDASTAERILYDTYKRDRCIFIFWIVDVSV